MAKNEDGRPKQSQQQAIASGGGTSNQIVLPVQEDLPCAHPGASRFAERVLRRRLRGRRHRQRRPSRQSSRRAVTLGGAQDDPGNSAGVNYLRADNRSRISLKPFLVIQVDDDRMTHRAQELHARPLAHRGPPCRPGRLRRRPPGRRQRLRRPPKSAARPTTAVI
jgi:hypothetical protein